MPPFISWFLYLSWVFLFMCVVCLFKWLDLQPHSQHVRLAAADSEITMEDIQRDPMEKATRIGMKVFLVLSIVFLVVHFIVIVAPHSSS